MIGPITDAEAITDALVRVKEVTEIARKALEDKSGDDAISHIEKHGLASLYNPFLRKTQTYIFRHGIADDKGVELLNTNIISASNKLMRIMEKSR